MKKLNKNISSSQKMRLLELLDRATIDVDIRGSSYDTMQEISKLLKKQVIEEIHDHKIFQSEGGRQYWFTYVHDESKPNNRRKIKRSTYEGICDALVDFFRNELRMNMTMQELFEEWIIFRRDETSAKPGTIRKDIALWHKYCEKFEIDKKMLSHYQVCSISTQLLYGYFRSLTKNRDLTHKTVSNIRCLLSGMLSYAVEKNIITTNPVREIDIKRLTYKPLPDKSKDVYTTKDVKKLFAYLRTIDDDPYALAIMLDFNLFARIGEISGLKWEDVNLEDRMVYICHQITYEPVLNDDLSFSSKVMVTEGYLKGATSKGYRYEYLTDEAVEILKKARKINPDSEYVFMPFGRPIITTTFNKRLRRYCEGDGISYHSSHKIRFYVASTAYNGENLVSLSRMMGHSNTATTLHYLRDSRQDDDISDLFKNLGSQA